MGVSFYWTSYYGDATTESALRQDIRETQPVWGVACDPWGCAFSDFGKLVSHDVDRIYRSLLTVMAARGWRFPSFYGEFNGEEFACSAIVIRQWMKDLALANRFPAIEKAVYDFATDPATTDDYDLINGLDKRRLEQLVGSPTFEQQVVYDYHRFAALSQLVTSNELRPSIYVVEDMLSPQFWLEVRKRMTAAQGLLPIRQASGQYALTGSRGALYHISLTTMSCTCEDFQRRGRGYGLHCKHLIACLREAGLWGCWEQSAAEMT